MEATCSSQHRGVEVRTRKEAQQAHVGVAGGLFASEAEREACWRGRVSGVWCVVA